MAYNAQKQCLNFEITISLIYYPAVCGWKVVLQVGNILHNINVNPKNIKPFSAYRVLSSRSVFIVAFKKKNALYVIETRDISSSQINSIYEI